LWVLVASWVASSFIGGVAEPVYHVMVTHSTRESWWGRLIGTRSILASVAGLGTAVVVWWVNRAFSVPANYVVLGWLGVAMLYVSLYLVSRLREVPAPVAWHREAQPLGAAFRSMREIYRADTRLQWLVIARVVRSAGFVLGTYFPAVFIGRCGLTETQMWLPLMMTCISEIGAHTLCGWFVDRFGAKPALVLSGLLIFVNSLWLMHCHTMIQFILLFPSISIGGSLLNTSWPTMILKLAPGEHRSAYWSAIGLAAAPGSVVASVVGVILVRAYGFDYVFYFSAIGGLIAAVLFFLKVPRLRAAGA
jgi:predicted MFS family arabinose efflux permease